MALKITRDPEAFLETRGQRRPREKLERHLIFIRRLPSLISGTRPVDAAHIRMGALWAGKRSTGKSEKPNDWWTVPLSRELHAEQHEGGEEEFWRRHGINPLTVAAYLWAASGDLDMAEAIIRAANARNPNYAWERNRNDQGH